MWLTYGVIGSFGMGITYTTTIAVCQKWFPDRRGFITGIIVSALGVGGLVFTPSAKALIAVVGFSYGGFLGVFPAITADFFGTKNLGVNYGMVLLGFYIGAVASS